jgi:AcrR family transcriptional regulator
MKEKNGVDFTRERLLDEAEALFAERGFDGVSVREITAKASCNLAAVNYHFGNKKNLYVEVFRSRWVPRARRLQEHFRKNLNSQEPPLPSDVARALAGAFLVGPMSDEERKRHHQLMSRELGGPTEAFELVADEIMRPFLKELAHMLRAGLPGEIERESLMLKLLSIFSMVLYFNFAREAVSRITGRQYDQSFKELLVEHIVEFVQKGLGEKQQEAQP